MLLQSFIVFSCLIFFMFLMGRITVIRDYNARIKQIHIASFCRIEILLLLLFFSIISGIRYDVGTDHLAYMDAYNTVKELDYEFIFNKLTLALRENGFHYSFYFFVCAFIQIFLLYYTLKNDKYLYPFLPFILICGPCYLSWMNGIRQDIASCVFFYATIFIYNKKIVPYLLLCLLAIGFHSSALLLIPLYWILKENHDFFYNKKFQYGMILFAAYVALTKADYLEQITPIVESFLLVSGEAYSSYSLNSLEYFAERTTAGNSMAFRMQIIVDLIIIAYSNKLKQEFKNTPIKLFYQLYFLGTFMETLFVNNLLLCRPFRYFRLYKLVMTAYLFCYLFRHLTKKNFIVLSILILLHLIMFVALLKNVTFLFFWQA